MDCCLYNAEKVSAAGVGFSTCGCAAAEGGGRCDGWCDGRGEVPTAVARRSGDAAATQAARQRQRQLGLHLLLHGLVLPPRGVRHEPGATDQGGVFSFLSELTTQSF